MQTDIGLIGLAVMGKNLVLNMRDHGFSVSVYNRTLEKMRTFLAEHSEDKKLLGFESLETFVQSLKRPRKVMLMIQAGHPIDELIQHLLPLLEPGDVIIDGGNSYFKDSERRCTELKEKGILFLGVGISGGEEGARYGPAIMPGGNPEAWPLVASMFQAIAAHVHGRPCCSWIGSGGAGHYVKAVHNGIEYGDIQLICEAYGLLRNYLQLPLDIISTIFADWNNLELESYLIRIAAEVLAIRNEDGVPVIDTILDVVKQKGTGKWIAIDALNSGVPLSLIIEAVLARFLSEEKEVRKQASQDFSGVPSIFEKPRDSTVFIQDIFHALYASKIISYAQGFILLGKASEEYNWGINLGELALLWRGGCIIQSAFLDKIYQGFSQHVENSSLLFQEYFRSALRNAEIGWRRTIIAAIGAGFSVPCFAAALTFYDGYRTANSSMALAQGLRDYFGAHSYERNDRPRGEFYHTDWVKTKITTRVK
ncbi:decarboxylating NADP(+)-dependent phosphogluconate dehydrogenase [Candidatus Chlamydia sanziniae]|uniref:6-phosphogluconate dehydrogenase, decarboxylating n=1 Tax=Candidatus Chlamydia sanziniae TaxID=1806891 RepID=A0A1A9HVR9_9CHLA|nr:decarboxylating NADP(+)-dependent phosphogluconate dehydrogenase [Candidatus Chlamydia sanziniae]ANH79099.1 6-phosphogluconate dehydrogenase, decarboxylating [Candidatus Chlamydia sanziniae]